MLIKKNFQGEMPANKIMGTYTESDADTYNCNYINELQTKKYVSDAVIVGYYKDGRPIYERVLEGILDGDEATIVSNTLNATSCEIIDSHGYIGDSVNGMPIGGYVNASWFNGIWLNTGSMYIYASQPLWYKPYKLIVQYILR